MRNPLCMTGLAFMLVTALGCPWLSAQEAEEQVAAVRAAASRRGLRFFAISGAAHKGLDPLVSFLGGRLEAMSAKPAPVLPIEAAEAPDA